MRKETSMLKLFRPRQEEQADPGQAPAGMRGRAVDISDPAALGWEVVWEALKTEPPTDDPSTLTQELGLDEERSVRNGYERDLPATEFSGTRHGRRAALRIGIVPSVRGRAMNEVEIAAPVARFRISETDGRLIAEQGALPEVGRAVALLAPAPKVWRDVVIDGGPDGIRARRPVTAHPQGYVYDLWLLERLADLLGA
jgi:hypothetical protein